MFMVYKSVQHVFLCSYLFLASQVVVPCYAAVLHPAVGVACVGVWRRGADVCACVWLCM